MLALRGLPPQQALLRRIPDLQVFHGYTHSSLLGTRDFYCSHARLYPFITTLNFLCRCKRNSIEQLTDFMTSRRFPHRELPCEQLYMEEPALVCQSLGEHHATRSGTQ